MSLGAHKIGSYGMNATSRSGNEVDCALASVKWPAAPYGKRWAIDIGKLPRPQQRDEEQPHGREAN
jgi:hypothetical protein